MNLYIVALAALGVALASGPARAGEPPAPRLYVATSEGIDVIDLGTNSVVDRYLIAAPSALFASRDGRRLLVASTTAEPPFEVVELDTETGRSTRRFAVPGSPFDMVESSRDGTLWVSHHLRCDVVGRCVGSDGVSVVDQSTGSLLGTIEGEHYFRTRLAIDRRESLIYSANLAGVAAIDSSTRAIVGDRPVACCLSGPVAVHPNDHTVYALGNEFGGFLAIADFGTPEFSGGGFLLGGQTLRDAQFDIAFLPDGTRAYLPGNLDGVGALFVLDTSDARAPVLDSVIDLDSRPRRIAIHRDTTAYLTDPIAAEVVVVDLPSATVAASISVGAQPVEIAIAPATSLVETSSRSSGCRIGGAATRTPPSFLFMLAAIAMIARRCGFA